MVSNTTIIAITVPILSVSWFVAITFICVFYWLYWREGDEYQKNKNKNKSKSKTRIKSKYPASFNLRGYHYTKKSYDPYSQYYQI
jgi:hypothetical protein